jgi:hypothetical protein
VHYREDLTEFERRLLLHIEPRSERRRLRRLKHHRRLYRLGIATLVFCSALLAVVVVVTVLLLLL